MLVRGGRTSSGDTGGGGEYPDAVVSAGAQVAWDLAPNGVTSANVGYRPSELAGGVLKILGDGTGGTTLPPTGWSIGVAGRLRSTTSAAAVLSGYDTNGRYIMVSHPGLAIRDCLIRPASSAADGVAIAGGGEANIIDTVVEYCTITGETGTTLDAPCGMNCGVAEHASATGLANTIVRNCLITLNGNDGIKVRGANSLIEKNVITVGGMGNRQAHWDGINVTAAGSGIVIQDNFINSTPNPNSFGRTSGITIFNVANIIIRRNIISYGADVLDNGWNDDDVSGDPMVGTWDPPGPNYYASYSGSSLTTNATISNNVFEYGIAAMENAGAHPYGIAVWTDNYRLSTGASIPMPT